MEWFMSDRFTEMEVTANGCTVCHALLNRLVELVILNRKEERENMIENSSNDAPNHGRCFYSWPVTLLGASKMQDSLKSE